jgi:hypothetical protein
MAKYWKENQEGLLNDGEALTILMMLYNEHPYVVQLPCLNKQHKMTTDTLNPRILYILQPKTEKRIKDAERRCISDGRSSCSHHDHSHQWLYCCVIYALATYT